MVIEKILMAVGAPLIAFAIGLSFLMLKRKIVPRIQRRYGPPIIQPIYDVIKLLIKEDNISHGVIFSLGPIIAIAGSVLSVFFIPMGGWKMLSGSADLMALLYIMVIGSLGMALGAGDSANPNASIGISRALTLMFGYDLPLVIIVISVALYYHTTDLAQIVAAQTGENWTLWSLPLSAIVGFVVVYGALGEHPFDIITAPHEVATGPMVEYGGKHLGMLMINHAFHIYLEIALFVDLFLGGGSNLLDFYIKMLVVFFIMILFDSVFPRFRIDDAVRFYWKWPTIIALISLVVVLVK